MQKYTAPRIKIASTWHSTKYTRNKNQENKAQKEDINHSIEINQELTQISELAKNKQTKKKTLKGIALFLVLKKSTRDRKDIKKT